MRHSITRIIAIGLFATIAIGCGDVGDAPEAKTDSAVQVTKSTGGTTWPIDTSRSKVSWVGAKITGSHEGGFRGFNGTVNVADGAVTGATINIDVNSIYTDDDNLVKHLKSDDFFSAEKFPAATFESSSFTKVDTLQGGATHMVTGNLTMRGKTNSVTFPATIQIGANSVNAKADFKINRKEWEIVYPGKPDDLISDDVRIIFDVTAAPAAGAS